MIVVFSCALLFLSVSGVLFPDNSLVVKKLNGPGMRAPLGIVVIWALYLPYCVGGFAVMRGKEWGRRLAVIMSMGLFSWSLCYKIMFPAAAMPWVPIMVYITAFIFLTGAGVKAEFE